MRYGISGGMGQIGSVTVYRFTGFWLTIGCFPLAAGWATLSRGAMPRCLGWWGVSSGIALAVMPFIWTSEAVWIAPCAAVWPAGARCWNTSPRLSRSCKKSRIAIYESGVKDRRDVDAAAALGADAVLVGSVVSAAPSPSSAVRQLTGVARTGRD